MDDVLYYDDTNRNENKDSFNPQTKDNTSTNNNRRHGIDENNRVGSINDDHAKSNSSDEIFFFKYSQNCCVSYVDISDSTKVTAGITNSEKIRKYYSLFLNTMADIINDFGGKIIKSAGDSLLYYFPETDDLANKRTTLTNVIECGLTMLAARDLVNSKLDKEQISSAISYRISADYGKVEVAKSIASPDRNDLFGSTVNMCVKINSKARPNEMVIGGDLYEVIRNLASSASTSSFTPMPSNDESYKFKGLSGYVLDQKHPYPVYSVKRRQSLDPDKIFERYARPFDLNDARQYKEEQPFSISTSSSFAFDTGNRPKKTAEGQRPDNIEQIHTAELQVHKGKQDPQSSYNILLVDDEPDLLFTYESILNEMGRYHVEAFSNPQEALKQFASNAPSYFDLVILDIRMPGLNGLQLFNRLKAINPNAKIIFLSALDAAEEVLSILPDMKDKDRFIRKPIDVEVFAKTIKTALA